MVMCVIAGNTLSFPIHWFHICPMKVRGSNLQGCHKHEIRQCAQGLVLRSAQYSSEHQLSQEVHFLEKALLCM